MPVVSAHNGRPVSLRAFVDGSMPHVSADIFSRLSIPNASALNDLHGEVGRDLDLVHNPTAAHRLPRGWLGQGREYELVGDHVEIADHRVSREKEDPED